MKKNRRGFWQFVVLGLLGMIMVLSLIVPQDVLVKNSPKRVEISILNRQLDNASGAAVRQGMEKAAEDLGAELRFLTLSTANDGIEQAELLHREAEMGVDGAVVIPADCKVLEESLKAWDGFPIVTMESAVKGAIACVSPDNDRIGRVLARQAVQDLNSQGKVLLISSCTACTGINLRMQAAQEIFNQAGVETECFTGQLSDLPDSLTAVLCLDSQSLIQVLELAKAKSIRPKIYGTEAFNAAVAALEEGEISALAVWSEYAQGYLAVTQAVCAARKEKIHVDVLPVTIVREGETYEPENQKLLYPVHY